MTFALVCFASIGYLIALFIWSFQKAESAKAKAEVYQEFADTFSGMLPAYSMKDKERAKLLSRRGYLRLALIDPHVRDGLRAALEEADEHWESLDNAMASHDKREVRA